MVFYKHDVFGMVAERYLELLCYFCLQPDDVELPRYLRDHIHSICFLDDYLRHFSFQSTNACSALEAFLVFMRYIKLRFSYLLTFLLNRVLFIDTRCV